MHQNNYNYRFASVFTDWKGSNVSIFEVNNINGTGQFSLIESVSSRGVSITDMADIIRPHIPSEIAVNGHMFTYVLVSKSGRVIDRLHKTLKCNMKQVLPVKDVPDALCEIPVMISDDMLAVEPHLIGNIEADLQKTELVDIPHSIMAIIQIFRYWNWLRYGCPPENNDIRIG